MVRKNTARRIFSLPKNMVFLRVLFSRENYYSILTAIGIGLGACVELKIIKKGEVRCAESSFADRPIRGSPFS